MTEGKDERPKQSQSRFLRKLVGKEVLVVFLDGRVVQGMLTAFDTYNLFLQPEDGPEVAVFKQSIKYVHAAPGRGG